MIDPETIAHAVYRTEVFRAAADALHLACPESDYKIEGLHESGWALMHGEKTLAMGPDLFMDRRRFEAARFRDYIESFAIRRFPAGNRSAHETGHARAPGFVETAN